MVREISREEKRINIFGLEGKSLYIKYIDFFILIREENKRRRSDETRSDHAHKMLERAFYTPKTTDYRGIYDKETQVRGVDAVFTYGGHEYNCDEKAAVNYVAKNLQTFSLELSFIDRANNKTAGWFLKDDSMTDSFIFVWFDKDTYEMALVEKKRINEYLELLGWNRDKLRRKAELIREGKDGKFGNIKKNGCKFSFSDYDWMPERPINVLVPRDKLIEMAVFTEKLPYEEKDKIIFGLS